METGDNEEDVVVLLDDDGNVDDPVALGTQSSGRPSADDDGVPVLMIGDEEQHQPQAQQQQQHQQQQHQPAQPASADGRSADVAAPATAESVAMEADAGAEVAVGADEEFPAVVLHNQSNDAENVRCSLTGNTIRRHRAVQLPCCQNMCSVKKWTERILKQDSVSKVCPVCTGVVPASLLQEHLPTATYVGMAHEIKETLFRNRRRHAVKTLSLSRLSQALQTLARVVKDRTVARRRSTKSTKVKHRGRETAWTKGVGFGGHSSSLSASKLSKAEKRQAQQDEKMITSFNEIKDILATHTPRGMQDCQIFSPKSAAAFLRGSASTLCLQAILHQSCLSAVLASLLRNDSVMDIATKRAPLYNSVVDLVETIARDPLLLTTILNPHDAFRHAYKAFLRQQEKRSTPSAKRGQSATPQRAKRARASDDANKNRDLDDDDDGYDDSNDADDDSDADDEGKTGVEEAEEAELDSESVCADFAALLKHISRQVKIMSRADRGGTDLSSSTDPQHVVRRFEPLLSLLRAKLAALPPHLSRTPRTSTEKPTAAIGEGGDTTEGQKARYVEELRPHSFRTVPMDYARHTYGDLIEETQTAHGSRKRMMRISKEIASLSTSVPVHFSSSIFVHVDETRPDVLKAMITGPEDTPYANGCFIFDIFLPFEYPNQPPKVTLVTTGRGRVRFGPNLYNNGKVCLSLLGTWSGPSWDPKFCTMLQVLVSIQSLILNEQPYFNEPGFEYNAKAAPETEVYNASVFYQTARIAMLGHLENMDGDFNGAIRSHLAQKKEIIKEQLEKLVADVQRLNEKFKGKKAKQSDHWQQIAWRRTIHDLSLPTPAEATRLRDALTTALDKLTVVDDTVTLE